VKQWVHGLKWMLLLFVSKNIFFFKNLVLVLEIAVLERENVVKELTGVKLTEKLATHMTSENRSWP